MGQGQRRETAVATNRAGTFGALMGLKLYVGSRTPPSHCPRRWGLYLFLKRRQRLNSEVEIFPQSPRMQMCRSQDPMPTACTHTLCVRWPDLLVSHELRLQGASELVTCGRRDSRSPSLSRSGFVFERRRGVVLGAGWTVKFRCGPRLTQQSGSLSGQGFTEVKVP